MKHVLAIGLFFFGAASSGRAAELSAGPGVAYPARPGATLIAPAPVTLVAYCHEVPTWWLTSPPLLRCPPQVFVRPESVGKLNEVKAIHPVRGPYPEISRFP
jgi:hypothetical protein